MRASWQGNITTTGGRVAAWFDGAGTMSLRIDGQTFTGDATNDGDIAGCDFDGFAPGSRLTAQVLLDGAVVGTRPVWTARDDGTVRGMWMSCTGARHGWGPAVKWAIEKKPDLLFFLGDMVYLAEGALAPNTLHGVARSATESGYDEAISADAEAWNSLRYALLHEGFQVVSQLCPILFQWDDHEIISDFRNHLGDGGDAGMQGQFAWIDTQEKLDAIKAARVPLAAGVYHSANPGSDYYYSLTYGPAHFIVPDLVTEKGSRAGTTMVGSTQLAWLKAQAENAAPFKMFMHTKTGTSGNADSWFDYGGLTDANSQLVDLWAHIAQNEIATCAVLTADKHWPHVQYNPNPSGMSLSASAFTPYLGICPCPANQFFTETGVDTDDIVWRKPPHNAVGYFEITRAEVTYEMLGTRRVVWTGRQVAGSNALDYKRARVA